MDWFKRIKVAGFADDLRERRRIEEDKRRAKEDDKRRKRAEERAKDLPCQLCRSYKGVTMAPDPVRRELHDDLTPVPMCPECRQERWRDV
jgi:hypothetical protein